MVLPSRVFFDNFFDDFESPKKLDKMMKCDIYEEDNNYVIEMDVPGFKKEDINMELDDGYLKISAEKKSDSEEKDGKKYVRRERHCYSKCERQFYVGNIKDEDIKAKFKDGILKISVPKEEEKKETKKVIMIED
ncbi:MAG: Hsp20/alpha crystallin family protein [bacterium]|nr:Hsp20/alpha crystallin family protein [bacterium]